MATLDPGPLDLRCFSTDSRPADVASMLYNGISDRSRGWKSSRSRELLGAEARMHRGLSVKRWDGSARIMSGWDSLRKVSRRQSSWCSSVSKTVTRVLTEAGPGAMVQERRLLCTLVREGPVAKGARLQGPLCMSAFCPMHAFGRNVRGSIRLGGRGPSEWPGRPLHSRATDSESLPGSAIPHRDQELLCLDLQAVNGWKPPWKCDRGSS